MRYDGAEASRIQVRNTKLVGQLLLRHPGMLSKLGKQHLLTEFLNTRIRTRTPIYHCFEKTTRNSTIMTPDYFN